MDIVTLALMCAGKAPIPQRPDALPPDDMRRNAPPAQMGERRRSILDCIRNAPGPVTRPYIIEKTGLSTSVCGKDLAYLKGAGLIESKRDAGAWKFTVVKK